MKTKIKSSFIKGFSRGLDLSGSKTWPKLSDSRKNDCEAMRSDWENVGKAIHEQINKSKGNG